jgi:hypothetical protein
MVALANALAKSRATDLKQSFSNQPLTRVQDLVAFVRLGEEFAAWNATLGIDEFSRRIEHRHIRPIYSKAFSHIPTAGRADEIDVGEHYVN